MRLALAQINPTIGDLEGNAALVAMGLDSARRAGADLVVFPELCLCGYPPKDLLLQEGFIESCVAIARSLGERATSGLTCVFGVPLPADPSHPRGRITNSLVAYRDNAFVDRHDKRLLPTYDVFDEDRYFTPGDRAVVIDVKGVRVGLSICEDLWKGEDVGFSSHYATRADPAAALGQAGVDLIVNPSASPFVLGKGARQRDILRTHATRHAVFVAGVNQVGGNDELIFDGHAAVFDPRGELVAAAPGFVEHLLLVEIEKLETEGSKLESEEKEGRDSDFSSQLSALSSADPLVTAPEEQLLFHALVLGIRDYLRKTGFKAAVLGISGGIDSALVATLAAAALGAGAVTGLVMPSAYSSEHSKADAFDLAERLGIRAVTIPIDPPVDGYRHVIDPAFASLGLPRMGAKLPDFTEENIQSRVRGAILMAWSNRTGAIVLTTGNKSELAVGYCTLYGDMNGGLAVVNDLTKRQLYRLSRWINANHASCGFSRPPIPERSITKPPSAELRPNQTDQDDLPPYEVLDQIIERFVERRESVARIVRETGIDEKIVRRMVRMIQVAEYKRKQLATGLKVTSVAFGFGRRWPIAQGWKA